MVALPPVRAEISGLAVPNSAVRLSLGKNSALATPMRALAATSCCSTWRRSGRRSSSADGNPAGTVRHHGLLVHGRPAHDRPGRLAEQDADLVFLGDDGALDLRDGGLGAAQRALGAGGLELGGDAEPEAILEQIVGALVGVGAVARDLKLHVERQQLEVRLGQVADQRQPHAAPGVLGGQEVRARRLVRATDAPPDVELPRHRPAWPSKLLVVVGAWGPGARAGRRCASPRATLML